MVLFLTHAATAAAALTPADAKAPFELWKAEHGKAYETASVHEYRANIFRLNKDFVEAHNAEFARGRMSYDLELNKFADLTSGEFLAMYSRPRARRAADAARWLGDEPTAALAVHAVASNETAPATMDWREVKNVVGPVKDQGSCGSCWAFSAVAAIEGAFNRKTSELHSFSEQELVDCTNRGENTCQRGGEMADGIEEIVKDHRGRMNTEQQYPYKGASSHTYDCEADDKDAIPTGLRGFVAIPPGDEDALKDASATKTIIAVGIDASSPRFQFYRSGVYAPLLCSSTNLDHGVAVVGYGTGDVGDYWIVRNSWGETWGLDGYVHIARNDGNKCGVATDAVYATFDA